MARRQKIPDGHPELALPDEDRELWQTSGLFSDHFLKTRIGKSEWWPTDDAARPPWEFCRELYRKRAFALRRYGNEQDARQELFDKIIDRLGFAWSDNVRLPKTRQDMEPDYILYTNPAAKEAVIDRPVAERCAAAVAILEVKKLGHPLSQLCVHQRRYPHQQIRDYLSEAQTLRWGILTNGNQWRLYCRDARASDFFGLDFEVAIQSLANFKYFLAMFSPDAFARDAQGKCRLDAVRDSALAAQSQLEADLRERIFGIVETLANGFAERADNRIVDADLSRLYDNCLIYLYRLLFVLYAEGGDLLPVESKSRKYYKQLSLARLRTPLRNFAEYDSPTQTRLYHELRELFHVINGTDETANTEFGVPRYNGGLFDPQTHADLEAWTVSDAVLAEVLRGLMFSPVPKRDQAPLPIETVDYADLSVQQLGSIYEGLLEHHFTRVGEKLVLQNDKAERKATGTYYTPGYIVKYIVEHTLGPLLQEIEAREPVQTAVAAGRQDNAFADEVMKLNVLDPAMGSGHFLVEATTYLADKIVYHSTTRFQAGFERGEAQEALEIAGWRRRVVEACIYGVDLNPLAVELAKLSLWLTTIAGDEPLSFLDHHLRCGNSLIGARLEQLSHLPDGKHRKPADDRQLRLGFGPDFTRAVAATIRQIQKIETQASSDVATVKDKKKRWQTRILPGLAPYREVADVWTDTFFGQPLSEEEYFGKAREILPTLELTDDQVAEAAAKYRVKKPAKTYFHWELEFPEVFFNADGTPGANPGFDAIIGNPPYVRPHKLARDVKSFLCEFYRSYIEKSDILNCFLEKSLSLTADGRFVGMITSDTWRVLESARNLRSLLLDQTCVRRLWLLPNGVFHDAMVTPVVVVVQKEPDIAKRTGNHVSVAVARSDKEEVVSCHQQVWMDDPHSLFDVSSPWVCRFRTKVEAVSRPLGDLFDVDFGLKSGDDTRFIKTASTDKDDKPLLTSRDIGRFERHWDGLLVWYRPDLMRANNPTARPGETDRFEREKVILSRMGQGLEATVDTDNYYVKDAFLLALPKEPYSLWYLAALLNSRTLNTWYQSTFTTIDTHRNEVVRVPIRRIAFTTPAAKRKRQAVEAQRLYAAAAVAGQPESVLDFAAAELAADRSDVVHDLLAFLAQRMIILNREKQAAAKQFLTDLKDFHGIDARSLKPKTRLDRFWTLEAAELFEHLRQNRKTLAAQGVRLAEADEDKIRRRFQQSQAAILALEPQLAFTDRLIDAIVYRLYDLTPEEIRLINGGKDEDSGTATS